MRSAPDLKNKRGLAMESAILFMMIIFSLCFLLTTVVLSGHHQTRIDALHDEQYIEREQIGEDYIAYLQKARVVTDSPDPEYSSEPEAEADPAPANFYDYLADAGISHDGFCFDEEITPGTDSALFELNVTRDGRASASVLYISAKKRVSGEVTILSWHAP